MNKEDILIALKEIHARYCIPASEQNYTDKDYACMQYEKLVIHLSNQLNKQKEVLDKIKEFCNEQIKLANIEIDECCRWRNADKEKYIITETNLSKAFLIKKCNKRILRVMDLVENDKYYNAKQIYEEELLEDIE